MRDTKAFGVRSHDSQFELMNVKRRELKNKDVAIDILYSGICHSDLHQVKNHWGISNYPMIPGHEIVGRVVAVAPNVTKYKVGDLVGVGCMVDSCDTCKYCEIEKEQYCTDVVWTYNSPDNNIKGAMTYGGYSDHVVVDENFVLKVSENLDLKGVAPLLCAGITTFSPLKAANVKKGDKVGVIGLGGLGHMAIKLAKAMGAEVTMLTTSPSKGDDAKKLGADKVLVTTNKEETKKYLDYFDVLINTIPKPHDLDPYLVLLRAEGTMVIVGAVGEFEKVNGATLIFRGIRVISSLIGGIQETQELLDFCAEHNIVAEVEVIDAQYLNQAFERLEKSDVKYRFVIDVQSIRNA